MGLSVRFFPFEAFHGKRDVGSSKIRVHNLVERWPEAELYKYGENPDVLIYQKVYVTDEFTFPEHFEGIQILDICDPDWMQIDVQIRRTVDAVDAVVCPTEAIKNFISQMTDKPVRVIKDRFDVSSFPGPKTHQGKAKKAVWFGYAHNADLLQDALNGLKSRDMELTIISDVDPMIYPYADDDYTERIHWKPYYNQTILENLQEHDICVLPAGMRPQDHFKSENKDMIARLCGLPVAKTGEDLDSLVEAEDRNSSVRSWHQYVREEYDVAKSVHEYQQLIGELYEQTN